MPRAAVIHNPVAGRRGASRAVEAAGRALTAAGYDVTPAPTQRAGHAALLAAELAGGVERVVAVGGDGTLREVAQGVVDAGAACEVALVPVGHGNVVAREFGIPLDPEGGARAAATGTPRAIDVLQVAGRVGVAMVGVGYDAQVVQGVDRARRRGWTGAWYAKHASSLYAAVGVTTLLSPRARRFRISVDGEELGSFAHALVCNVAMYAKDWAVLPDANACDGELDWQARRTHGPLHSAAALLAAKRKRAAPCWVARSGRAREVRIEAEGRPLVWQVDGDPQGETQQLTIEVRPGALRFVAP